MQTRCCRADHLRPQDDEPREALGPANAQSCDQEVDAVAAVPAQPRQHLVAVVDLT